MTEERLLEIIAKTFEGIAELKEEHKKTEEMMHRTFAEIREDQRKTDEQIKKTFEGIAELKEERKETYEQMKRTDERLDKVAKLVGNMSNNQGDVAEEFFYNSLKDKQELGGIKYDYIDKNITRTKGKIADEFDIVMINGKDVAIIEVKYKAHERDLEKLLTKKYNNFKELYPMYSDYNHHLGLASFYMSDDLKELALDSGVMVLQRKGDVVETYMR